MLELRLQEQGTAVRGCQWLLWLSVVVHYLPVVVCGLPVTVRGPPVAVCGLPVAVSCLYQQLLVCFSGCK